MIEKTEDEYNQKIGELYAIIENKEKIINKAIEILERKPYLNKIEDALEILKGGNNES